MAISQNLDVRSRCCQLPTPHAKVEKAAGIGLAEAVGTCSAAVLDGPADIPAACTAHAGTSGASPWHYLVLVAFAPRIILFSLAPVVVCLAPEAALAISEARLGCIVCPVRDKVCRNQPAGILDFSKSTVRGNIFTDRAPLFSARISVFSSRPNLPYRKPVTSSYIKQQVFKLHHCQHE